MPRLPPVMRATFPDRFLSALLAIQITLSHSHSTGESREKLSATSNFCTLCACPHRIGKSLGGGCMGSHGRRKPDRARGSHPLFSNLRPLFHDFRHSSILCLPT